ncbi:PilT/PilU family type 4a pilus ATPase [bacterium]|nr:PilT/PilU family type 4a pilus ATPase [candidate division CSSED10-310 bacterium]
MARIDAFLKLVVEQKASDLHFVAGNVPILRVNGELLPVKYRKISSPDCMSFINEIIPHHLKELFESENDVDFGYQLNDVARFRVNLYRHREGVGATFRMIPMDIPSVEEIHLPQVILKFADIPKGLVLITGPTGSGKSTTLATIIEEINRKYRRHILTIEDPIEFMYRRDNSLISQREVHVHTQSFHAALRAATRGSADVILVGEMRDTETISLALTAAETGSLVFGTLHTQSCAQAITRIVDVFTAERQPQVRNMLSASLRGVVSQLLLKRADARGRVPVLEIVFGSPALAHMIREGKTHQIHSYIETSEGETTLNISRDNSLYQLMMQDLITPEQAYQLARDKNKFMHFLD